MNQIALSVVDREASSAFYRELFGLRNVGGTHFTGKVTEKVQGMPGATSDVSWHMDDREFFQLELFQFSCPTPRAYAAKRQPWDIGYSRLAIEVADPVAFHAKCAQRQVSGLTPIKHLRGRPFFCLNDPNGVLIEVGGISPGSQPLGANTGARLVGVALSVPSLDVAVNSFQQTIGCPLLDAAPMDKGSLWGESPAQKRSVLLDAGTAWLEINEYACPVAMAWPEGYRICDHGLLNVAFGFRSAVEIRDMYQRMVGGGFRPNTELVSVMGQTVLTYLNDTQGFNVELLMVKPVLDGVMGFRQANSLDRLLMKISMALA